MFAHLNYVFLNLFQKIAKDFLGDEDSQQSFASSASRSRRSGGSDSDKKRAKRATPEEMMKRRIWTLYKAVYDYTVCSWPEFFSCSRFIV